MADNPVVEVFICSTVPEDFVSGYGPYGGKLQFKDDRVTHINEVRAILEAGCDSLGYTVSFLLRVRRTHKEYGHVQAIIGGAS